MRDLLVELVEIAHVLVVIAAGENSKIDLRVALAKTLGKRLEIVGRPIGRDKTNHGLPGSFARECIFAGLGQRCRSAWSRAKERFRLVRVLDAVSSGAVQKNQINAVGIQRDCNVDSNLDNLFELVPTRFPRVHSATHRTTVVEHHDNVKALQAHEIHMKDVANLPFPQRCVNLVVLHSIPPLTLATGVQMLKRHRPSQAKAQHNARRRFLLGGQI